ncbi:MAG: hypothetical protein R6W91_05885, partial [Thermoplasmata archaeon]
LGAYTGTHGAMGYDTIVLKILSVILSVIGMYIGTVGFVKESTASWAAPIMWIFTLIWGFVGIYITVTK